VQERGSFELVDKIFDNSDVTANSKQVEVLRKHFPQCFDKHGKFIPQKLQEIVGDGGVELSKESYRMDWLGKSYARLLANENPRTWLAEDKEHNQKPENENSENLLIKGDNLEVLKHLVNAYSEKVKMIYIDPPYNTGSDGFAYQDDRKFTVDELSRLAGIDKDEAKRILDFTQSKANSHSAWLTFMYPRLYVAKELLQEDGVIFISIDDNELAQLKMLCDEVFGEENFVEAFTWHKKNSAKGVPPINMVVNIHEYILCYSKNQNTKLFGEKRTEDTFSNTDNDPRGLWRRSNIKSTIERPKDRFTIVDPETGNEFTNYWAYSRASLQAMIDERRILFPRNADGLPKQKEFLSEFSNPNMPIKSHLGLFHSQDISEKKVDEIMGGKFFLYRKPVELIKRVVEQAGDESGNIVLDFFAGSGTTADAIMQLNAEDRGTRKFIMVQLPESCDEKSEAYKAGYKTIFDIAKARIEKSSKKIKEENPKCECDLGVRIYCTTSVPEGYGEDVKELSAQQTIFDGSKFDGVQLDALLTTWKVYDGIPLTQKLDAVMMGKYSAWYFDKNLYLLQAGFTTEALKALIEKVDGDKSFSPVKVVLFGYNFSSKHQREIKEALGSYANKKSIDVDVTVRY